MPQTECVNDKPKPNFSITVCTEVPLQPQLVITAVFHWTYFNSQPGHKLY